MPQAGVIVVVELLAETVAAAGAPAKLLLAMIEGMVKARAISRLLCQLAGCLDRRSGWCDLWPILQRHRLCVWMVCTRPAEEGALGGGVATVAAVTFAL